MLEFERILVDCTLCNITENFTKSYSVNMCNVAASKEVYSKIIELGKYDFDLLIQWIKLNQDVWYKEKFKVIRRFVYMMDDVYHNRDFPEDGKYIYFNSNSNYLLLSNEYQELIDKYFLSNETSPIPRSNKGYISSFLIFIQKDSIDISHLSYEDIRKFIKVEKDNRVSEASYARTLNCNRHFLEYCYYQNIVSNALLSFIMDKKIICFYEYLVTSAFNTAGLPVSIIVDVDTFIGQIVPFKAFLNEKKYNKHHLQHIPYEIRKFVLFLDLYHIEFTQSVIDFYCLNVIKPINKSYKETRTTLYRYYNFVHGIQINFNTVMYFKEKNFNALCPDWARNNVKDYLDYRKHLGFKKSTLEMDANSILRVLVYLDTIGIKDFKQVTAKHILQFRDQDEHSTLEGKNAYQVRIKQFFIYLSDKDVIEPFVNPIIFKGYRLPKKLITVIHDDILTQIYQHKDDFVGEFELRSYCLFLLGVRLGMRAIDAIKIKRNNISFKNLTITFIQQKTQKQITLPMPVMVANSIYRYMKSIQHISNHEYLFQTLHAPYRVPSKTVCTAAIKVVFDKIDLNYEGVTFHTLRKTYASNIVNNSHSTTDAAYALGHSDNTTVDKYLHLNKSKMQCCCMNLHLIPFGGFVL